MKPEPKSRYDVATRVLILVVVVTGTLAMVAAPNSAETSSSLAAIKGRVELLTTTSRKRDGGSSLREDASGVVVWISATDGRKHRTIRSRRLMRQQSKRFIPHVLATEVGTEVDFPNEDPFFHNVFSIYNGRRFDLGLYASGETRPVAFTRPGISFICCNIHPQMSAVVLALDTPFHTVSDRRGLFSIEGIPEGRYRVEFWHERSTQELLATLTREVQIGSSGLDLGLVRISEEGFVPSQHRNKHGEEYDVRPNLPAYRKP